MRKNYGWIAFAMACSARAACVFAEPIDTIYVLAPRRAVALTDVPMSVTTLSAVELDAAGLDTVDMLATHVPTLDMQRSVGLATTTLRIRRIGTLGNVPTLEPAVGLFVDGAYRQRSFLANDLLEIGRIEVLAGPQSTFYGRNVSAGVVALYTREPPDEISSWAEITGGALDVEGSPDLLDVSAGTGGPLSQSIRASLASAYSSHGHTISNALAGMPDGNDESRWNWRGQVSWSGGPLRARMVAGYVSEHDDQGESDVYLAPGSRTASTATTLAQRGLAPTCPDNAPHNRRTCSIATNELQLELLDVTLNLEAALENGWTLASTSAWERFEVRRFEDDVVQLFAPILYFHDAQEGTSLQQELRLLSPDEARVSWLAGIFHYRDEFERGARGAEPTFGPNGALAYDAVWPTAFAQPDQHGSHDSRTRSEYWSVFADATWTLSTRIQVGAGARWHEEGKRARIANSVTSPGPSVVAAVLTPAATATGAPINGRLERSSAALTWSITPKFRLNDRMMTYATAARSTKAGGFNNGTGSAPLAAREFGDETIHHYEIGIRSASRDQLRTLSGAVFHTRYDDYQDAVFLLAQFAVGNAERVDVSGFELAGKTLLGERTTLDAAISYVEVEYARHTAGVCHAGRVPDGSLPASCDLSGERPLNAPPWETHLGLQHTVPVRWGELFGRLDWSWTDHYHATFSADPRLEQAGHHELSLRVGGRIRDSYEVTVWGRNLLGEDIVQIASTLNFFNDESWQSFLGEPRSYGVTLRARF